MKKLHIILILFLFILTSAIFGQQPDYASFGIDISNSRIPHGLKEGDRAPDFTGYDQTGKQVTLKGFLEQGPVVMFFYRGNWCPACNKQLKAYQDSINLITGQGASVVAITPESIEFVEQTVKMHGISFTVIYDCQEKIMEDYDLMFDVTKDFQDLVAKQLKTNIAEHNGHTPAHLPVTATYIINRTGTITATWFDPDYHKRASVMWVVQKLATAL
jgi:peroxiredoxin